MFSRIRVEVQIKDMQAGLGMCCMYIALCSFSEIQKCGYIFLILMKTCIVGTYWKLESSQ